MRDQNEPARLNCCQLILESVKHEDDLLNHRMTWMWTLQGLLFTALGLLWRVHALPAVLICIVGLLSCAPIGFSLRCSVRALQNMDKARQWASSVVFAEGEKPVMGLGKRDVKLHFLLPWNFLPTVMAVVWGFMLVLVCLSHGTAG